MAAPDTDALKALGQAWDVVTGNPSVWRAVMDDLEAKAASIPDSDHRAGATLLLLHIIRRTSLTRHLKANGTSSRRSRTTLGGS